MQPGGHLIEKRDFTCFGPARDRGVASAREMEPSRKRTARASCLHAHSTVIRKLKSGEYRLYSRKKNPKTGKRRNLGTFRTREAAQKHERAVQYFKRH